MCVSVSHQVLRSLDIEFYRDALVRHGSIKSSHCLTRFSLSMSFLYVDAVASAVCYYILFNTKCVDVDLFVFILFSF